MSRLSQERQGEGQRQTPKPERNSHKQHEQHEQYRHQHVSAAQTKARTTRKGKGKCKQMDVVETNQPSETASILSYPSQTPSTIGALSYNPEVELKGWIMGVTINSLSFLRRQVGAEYLLVDSGVQLHASPIKYLRQIVPFRDPAIHSEWSSPPTTLRTAGEIQTSRKQNRTSAFSMRARFRNPSSLLVVSLSSCTGVIFAHTGTLFFLDKIQTQHSQAQLHKE